MKSDGRILRCQMRDISGLGVKTTSVSYLTGA